MPARINERAMTDLQRRINEWALSTIGQQELTATVERVKRTIKFIKDETRTDPDNWNIELPEECPNTLEHALLHVQEILATEKVDGLKPDMDQVYHDANIAFGIISNLIEQASHPS